MNILVKAQIGLAIIGLIISSYLLSVKLFNLDPVCGISTCGIVNNSKFAIFLGVPVSAWGIIFYSLVAILAYIMRFFNAKILFLNLFISAIGVIFSLYLTYLEAFVIKAWCQWCVASAWVSFCYFIVALRLTINRK